MGYVSVVEMKGVEPSFNCLQSRPLAVRDHPQVVADTESRTPLFVDHEPTVETISLVRGRNGRSRTSTVTLMKGADFLSSLR
jgi:hypothetical protein